MCHIANIIYKYPQISSTASSHDLKMMQRTVSHICESILIAALVCRVLCVKIKKALSLIRKFKIADSVCALCLALRARFGLAPSGGIPKVLPTVQIYFILFYFILNRHY